MTAAVDPGSEPAAALRGLSSMATKPLFTDLAAADVPGMPALVVESSGGVEIAQRIRDGEAADLVILADDAVAALAADGLAGEPRPLFRSEVVVAVPAGGEPPAIGTVDELRVAIDAAAAIGYSTGPSGTALRRLLDIWGLDVTDRLVQARPGVPVARLLADGAADLGFQQRSELDGAPGVTVLGPMPPGAEIVTTFSGAVLASAAQPEAAVAALVVLAGPAVAEIVRANGMEPAG